MAGLGLSLVTGCVIQPGTYVPPRSVAPPPPAPSPVAMRPVPVAAPPTTVATAAPTPLPDGVIVEMYVDVLGREPSWEERRNWRARSSSTVVSRDDLRHELLNSREYHELAPETVIRRAYRELHGREPDVESMRYYRRRLVDDHWTAGRVRQAIARDRNERRGAPTAKQRDPSRDRENRGQNDRRVDLRNHDLLSAEAIVERAYDDLLEREPDPAGLAHYRQLLDRGASEADIRARIRESEEYRVTLPDSKTKRAYREVLGREPDASGLESYRRKLVDSGWTEEDVKNDLRRSAEYRNRKT
jgi:hypothetical protein